MSAAEIVQPTRKEEVSLVVLALRVLRGELTEAEALEIVRAGERAGKDAPR